MDHYADVLDHLDRTPREFGALQLHVEPVTRGPWGNAVAVLWLQGAFEPQAPGGQSLLIMGRQKAGLAQKMLGQFPLPPLEGGRVVRWRLPLSVPAEIDELHVEVRAPLHPKAERVRPAWKLLDTLEMPKESTMNEASAAPRFDLTRSVVGSVLTGGLVVSVRTGGAPHNGEDMRVKRHAAAPAPTVLVVAVVDGAAVEPLDAPHVETVWSPGMPLPNAPSQAPVPQATPPRPLVAKATRTCFSCFFEGPSDTYGRATMCPMCDAPWN